MSEEFNNYPLSEDEEVDYQERNKFSNDDPEVQQTESEKTAEDFGIDASITEVEETSDAITGPSYAAKEEVQSLGFIEGGVIGATKKPRGKKEKPSNNSVEISEEKVAIYSDKNYYWAAAGKVYRGYNIVTKDKAEKWLTRTGVRLATPEEVANEFGV